jgi:cupin 2 domain-containing protein
MSCFYKDDTKPVADLMRNLFADIPEHLRDELIETILQTSSFYVERIVSRGHCSPAGFWYDQDENEWVILLKGSAHLRFDDQKDVIILKSGDYLHIDRHQRHRVEWTDPEQETIWLAVHYGDLDK